LVTPPTTPEYWRSAIANPNDPLSRPSRSPSGSAYLLSDREIATPAWPTGTRDQSECAGHCGPAVRLRSPRPPNNRDVGVAGSPELHMAAGVSEALRERGVADPGASILGEVAIAISASPKRWVAQ
jgi:hypothetical protein